MAERVINSPSWGCGVFPCFFVDWSPGLRFHAVRKRLSTSLSLPSKWRWHTNLIVWKASLWRLYNFSMGFCKSKLTCFTVHYTGLTVSQSIKWLKGYSFRPHNVVQPIQVGFCRLVSWVEFPCCQVVILCFPQLANQMKHGAQIHVSRGVLQEGETKKMIDLLD